MELLPPFEVPDTFLDLLKHLVRVPAVVGAELPFFREVARELDEAGIPSVAYEGLLVAQGNQPASGYVSAHCDRHGLICTGPDEFQYAAYIAQNRGDLTGKSISEQTFRTLAGRFAGEPVMAYNPWSGSYYGQGVIHDAELCERRGNLLFRVDGLAHLFPGTPLAYVDRLSIRDGKLSAQLDNVLSAALLIDAYRQGYQGTAFFTAQEEAGRSWRFLLEWFRRRDVQTDRLLVLDLSPFSDEAEALAQDLVLRRADAHADFSAPVVDELCALAETIGARTLFKDERIQELNTAREDQGQNPLSLGSTELGRLLAAADEGEIQGATLQMPSFAFHTANETTTLASVGAARQVLRRFLDF